MASTDITLIGLDEATLSDDLVTVLADPSTNGGYKASVGDLGDYIIANAGLDYTDTATNGTYVKAVSESDGVISVTRETADTTPTENSTKLITSGGVENALSMELTSVSGNPITISDASNTNCELLMATISPTQSGTGDPSPTNVRPISGVNQLSVNRTGKNIAPFVDNIVASSSNLTLSVTSDGGIHISGTPSRTWADLTTTITTFIPSGTTITLSRSVSRNYSMFITLAYTDGSTSELIAYSGTVSATLTLSKDVSTIKLHLSFLSTSTNYNETIYPQLEFGSSATTYEPYQGTAITLNLGSTVYGGSVDLTSGVLTVDRVGVTFDGSSDENWSLFGSGSASTYAMKIEVEPTPLVIAGTVTVMANYLKGLSRSATWGTFPSFVSTYPSFVSTSDSCYIVAGINTITTVADWKTYLASNNLQVVYELATPLTTQLTPQTLRLLQGNNTLWTNGESLEVQYQPNNYDWFSDQLS